MPQPTVSVVIPTYNYAHLISKAIDSVLTQTCPPLEIVIIDDGSEDDTGSVISRYENNGKIKIAYIRTENAGAASARNLGIRKACGNFVLLLDADDLLLPDAIETLLKPVILDPTLELVIGGCFAVDASGQKRYRPMAPLKARKRENFQAYLESKTSISHGRFIVRREFFNKVQYPTDFRSSEDISVFALLFATCNACAVDHPTAVIFHHRDSLRNNPEYILGVGLKVVDAVFDKRLLPADFFEFRSAFRVKRCLSIFRTLNRAGYYQPATQYYHMAIRESFPAIFRWSFFSKYIRMQLKNIFTIEARK